MAEDRHMIHVALCGRNSEVKDPANATIWTHAGQDLWKGKDSIYYAAMLEVCCFRPRGSRTLKAGKAWIALALRKTKERCI